MNKLDVNHISKSYKNKSVVNDWSKKFMPGYYALIGPNGSGKSTLLSLLSGVVAPDAGEIVLSGISLQKNPYAYKQLMTYVPDRALFYLNSKAYEFLNYVISIRKIKNNALAELKRILTRFDLINHLDQTINDLSLGMQKKLFLSTMMISNSLLLLFDEPTNGLDKEAEAVFVDELRKMSNKIVIFSTHKDGLLSSITPEIINFY